VPVESERGFVILDSKVFHSNFETLIVNVRICQAMSTLSSLSWFVKVNKTLSRTAGPVGPPAGLVGPLFDIAFEIHFDEVGMFFFEI